MKPMDERERVCVQSLNGIYLNSCAVSDRLIWIDALVELFAIEELLEKLLDLGNTRGASDKHNFVDLALVQLGVLQRLVNWSQGRLEQVSTKLFESSARYFRVEIETVMQRVDLDVGLGSC